jgi:hypothetical protein
VGGGRVERWYTPHTKAQELLDEGDEDEDISQRARSSLTKSISGDEGSGKGLLDCAIHEGTGPCWLAVGSDGVFNHVGGSELKQIVEKEGKRGAKAITRGLLAKSLENGRAEGKRLDNATVAVLSWNRRRPVLGAPTMWVPGTEGEEGKRLRGRTIWEYAACLAPFAAAVWLGLALLGKMTDNGRDSGRGEELPRAMAMARPSGTGTWGGGFGGGTPGKTFGGGMKRGISSSRKGVDSKTNEATATESSAGEEPKADETEVQDSQTIPSGTDAEAAPGTDEAASGGDKAVGEEEMEQRDSAAADKPETEVPNESADAGSGGGEVTQSTTEVPLEATSDKTDEAGDSGDNAKVPRRSPESAIQTIAREGEHERGHFEYGGSIGVSNNLPYLVNYLSKTTDDYFQLNPGETKQFNYKHGWKLKNGGRMDFTNCVPQGASLDHPKNKWVVLKTRDYSVPKIFLTNATGGIAIKVTTNLPAGWKGNGRPWFLQDFSSADPDTMLTEIQNCVIPEDESPRDEYEWNFQWNPESPVFALGTTNLLTVTVRRKAEAVSPPTGPDPSTEEESTEGESTEEKSTEGEPEAETAAPESGE